MPKKKTDNGPLPDQATFEGDDFAAIRRSVEKLCEHDAANPTDDFNPGGELKRILRLRTKIENAKKRSEVAKTNLKETFAYQDSQNANESYKGLLAELDDLLTGLGREYPLFEGREV